MLASHKASLTGLSGPKKLKRPNLAISSFKKAKSWKMKKAKFPFKKLVKITKLRFKIL